jgi:hypothetical protein
MRKQFGSTLVIGNGNGTGGGDGLRVLRRLEELVELVEHGDELFVRWSEGPDADASERSCDAASGLGLPGLAVNPLRPPGWWTLPTRGWLARQVRAYAHLGEDGPAEFAWVLTGRVVDRGPDNEPLVVDVGPVARLAPSLLQEAEDDEPRSPRPQDDDTSWRSG